MFQQRVPAMNRKMLVLAAVPLGIVCWLGMEAFHELGHLIGAWASGGKVQQVVLDPLTISRTDVSPNPHPLVVVWAGPIIGVVLPLAVAIVLSGAGRLLSRSLFFFAGFCLIANGLYIGVGSFEAIGDAGDMLRHGSRRLTLILFGAVSALFGLWVWHCLTRRPSPRLPAENASR
jgi:hypothetical protein